MVFKNPYILTVRDGRTLLDLGFYGYQLAPAILYSLSVTNPRNSFKTSFGRFYAHPSSGNATDSLETLMNKFPYKEGPYSPKPSVTNIIGMIDKSFLPGYYAKLVAEYAVNHLDTLNYQVEKFGPDVAIGTLKSVPNLPHKNAAIGDEIHDAIDRFCKSGERPDNLSLTASRMYDQWLNFSVKHPMEIVMSEFTVWSYKHGYAGTGDLMLETSDGLGIVDTKSGNRLYPEVALQTAALSHADVILGADGTEHPMPEIAWHGAIHIRPMSLKLYRLLGTDEAWETFLAAKRIFDWKRFDAPTVIPENPLVFKKDAA